MHFRGRLRKALLGAGCGVFALVQIMLLCVQTAALDVRAFPKPPEIFSEAAILMDADTGQILYGKQEHKRMYPASLTKIMTCLLAMKNGRYSDRVTVTQEGSFAPVAYATHIALTEGEVLTLEQLTYAMMVQSANDAANTIALHLGGSFPMFARMMNEAAVEAGAQGTNFVNPSGLPDDNHYTTAYDLAMITKAALADPAFRKFAGTQRYEMPPTNKNDSTRVMNNGNYMFSLGDTYDGAFAGKTGWTQEAGNTLMTVAERDGVTLICIVLKAKGVVDAQFKDSTALLDYGFDNFRRVTLGEDRFPVQQLEYTDAAGETQYARIFPAKKQMLVLLPTGVSDSDLQIVTVIPKPLREEYLSRIRVEIRVPEAAGEVMKQVAGSFPVDLRPMDLVAEMTAVEDALQPIRWDIVLQLIGLTLLACLAAGVVLLVILRKSVRLYYRALLRGRCRQTHWNAAECFFFSTHVFWQEELIELQKSCAKEKNFFGLTHEDLQVLRKAHLEAKKLRLQRKAAALEHKRWQERLRQMDADETPFVWKKAEEQSPPQKPSKPVTRPVAGARMPEKNDKEHFLGRPPQNKKR